MLLLGLQGRELAWISRLQISGQQQSVFAGLFSGDWRINAVATIVLAHGMIISAYMLHECAHNTIFKKNDHNATLGRMLMWLNGSCYGTYEDVRHKHFRHHVDNGDLCWFEYRKWFERHPPAHAAAASQVR